MRTGFDVPAQDFSLRKWPHRTYEKIRSLTASRIRASLETSSFSFLFLCLISLKKKKIPLFVSAVKKMKSANVTMSTLVVLLAIMATDKTIDPYHRIGYFWLLIAINLVFFVFWIAFYLKILLVALLDVKYFKNLLERKGKETILSKIVKAISNCIRNKKSNESDLKRKPIIFKIQN